MVRTRVLAGAAHEISSDQQRGSPAHALLMLKVTRRAQLRVPSLALVPALSVQQASATCGFHRRSQGPFIPSPAHSLTHSPRLVHDGNSSLQRAGLRHWENWASGQSGPERLGEPGHWGLKGQGHSGPLRWCTSVFLPVKWSCLRGKGVRLEEQKCQHCAVPDRCRRHRGPGPPARRWQRLPAWCQGAVALQAQPPPSASFSKLSVQRGGQEYSTWLRQTDLQPWSAHLSPAQQPFPTPLLGAPWAWLGSGDRQAGPACPGPAGPDRMVPRVGENPAGGDSLQEWNARGTTA